MGAHLNIKATVPPPLSVQTTLQPGQRQTPIGIVASELFTRLALTYAQLRDEFQQLERNPFSCSIERADLLCRMGRVRARMASVPIYVR